MRIMPRTKFSKSYTEASEPYVDATITDTMEESFIDTSEPGGLRDVLNVLDGLVTIEENQVPDTETFSTAGPVTKDTPAAGNGRGAHTFKSQHLSMDTRIRLAHFSVKDDLECKRILGSKAVQFYLESAIGHQILAKSCITYLRYYSISPEKTLTEKRSRDISSIEVRSSVVVLLLCNATL